MGGDQSQFDFNKKKFLKLFYPSITVTVHFKGMVYYNNNIDFVIQYKIDFLLGDSI